MDLTAKLDTLRSYMDNRDADGFKTCLKSLYEKSSSAEKEVISGFVENELGKSTQNVKNTVNNIQIRMQLGDVIDILPLSYISKHYFKKTRQWLYQRINRNVVNGKSAQFSESEIEIFNFALRDISKKIGSIAIHS
jgi:hypothetical protein